MKRPNTWQATAVAGFMAVLPTGLADDTADEIKALRQQIEALAQKVQTLEQKRASEQDALDQKVKVIERTRELDQEASAEKAKQAPRVSIGSAGLTVSSADTNFVVGLHGLIQLDNRTFVNDGGIAGNDGFLLRRARPILQGTVYRDFDFLFIPDFGGSTVQIFDANLNYRYSSALQIRAGKFKSPVGLEQLQTDRDLLFNERALATDLVPNRDLGVQVWGDIADGAVSYAAGILNGVGDFRNSSNLDFDNDREFGGRIFLRPFKNSSAVDLRGLGFGLGGSYGSSATATGLPSTTGGTLPGLTTDGQQQFFAYNPSQGTNAAAPVVVASGEHWRLSPQGYYYVGPFGLLGEYVISDQRVSRTTTAPFKSTSLEDTAWQITGSWALTGEAASYNGLTPANSFDPRTGHWGALQLVGRFAELDVDRAAFPLYANPATSAHAAYAWSAGFNWYLNKNLKLATSFSQTIFGGGGGAGTSVPAIVTRQPESVFFTRLQLSF